MVLHSDECQYNYAYIVDLVNHFSYVSYRSILKSRISTDGPVSRCSAAQRHNSIYIPGIIGFTHHFYLSAFSPAIKTAISARSS